MNMKTIDQNQKSERRDEAVQPRPEAYEAPRITRKRSLERVTLGTGTVTPGGGVGGN
jgi:hypothetical protein